MSTVLIVDDEEVNVYALRIILESRGYRCLAASNGVDALRLASDLLPDTILLDIQMPVMDGYEVCRRLKQDPRTTPIPILFLTARYRDMQEVIRGLDLGANDYVTKPFNPEELLARVAVMVRVRLAEEAMRHASITDELTGLHNRRYLQQRLEDEMDRAARYHQLLSCVIFDIDHFKKINDTHGHAAGDFVLKELALLLKHHVRRSDLAVRYGGEEFLLILLQTGMEQAVKIAERVRADVERQAICWRDQELKVTISSGVAACPHPRIITPDDLISRADSALYAAKTAGRNMVRSG